MYPGFVLLLLPCLASLAVSAQVGSTGYKICIEDSCRVIYNWQANFGQCWEIKSPHISLELYVGVQCWLFACVQCLLTANDACKSGEHKRFVGAWFIPDVFEVGNSHNEKGAWHSFQCSLV